MKKLFQTYVMIYNVSVIFLLMYLIYNAFREQKGLSDGGIFNVISLVALTSSLPTMYTSIKDIYYPDKKKIKLTGKCPNCKHLVEYQLEEN